MFKLAKQTARVVLSQTLYQVSHRWAQAYRRWHARRLPRLSEKDLRAILTEQLGVRMGDVVFVHSSVDGMHLGFSFARVLNILQETVGQEGTLLFPCNSYLGRAEDALRRGDVFDVRRTVTNMGMIAELARRQAGACRSLHPTNSVVALGRYAKQLTETHQNSIYPCGEESPYYKTILYHGLVVGLGVTTATLSLSHAVEDVMRDAFPVQTRTTEVFDGRVIDGDGQERIVRTLAAHENIQRRNVPKYFRRHIPKEIGQDLRVDGVDFFTVKAAPLAAKMTELARQKVTIYTYR